MKRTDEEFKAEVFRRFEEYRRDRRQCVRRVVACCVPLVLIAVVTAVWLPQILPTVIEENVWQESCDAVDESGTPETVWLQITVVDDSGETRVLSQETADRLWAILGEEASDTVPADKRVTNESVADTDTSWSHPPLYDITITTENGVIRQCKVFEKTAYIFDDGRVSGVCGWIEMEAEQADALRALLQKQEE